MNMDVRLQHPYTCLVAGPTPCGKTQFVKKIIEEGEHMANEVQKKLYGCVVNINQPTLSYHKHCQIFHLLKEFQKT